LFELWALDLTGRFYEKFCLHSETYTYPAVARVKRSILDKVLFEFKVQLKPYEWSRVLGNSKIGGSFGVKFRNSVEGMFRKLESFPLFP
jgi:hypothetical protein